MTAIPAADERAARQVEQGVRPFDIRRDLRPVADLIAESFAGELDERGAAALREMRAMSHFGGLLSLVNRTTGDFKDVLSGFVWVEDGRVVGNITVQRASQRGDRWQIANVAVAPAYRRRGIANRLMDVALEHVQNAGGRWAVLQVYARNDKARRIYENRDFEYLSGMANLETPAGANAGVALPPHISNFHTFSASQWPELYDLASRQLNENAQWWRSVRRSEFQITMEQQIGEWFSRIIGRRKVYRRCIQTTRRFDAAVVLTAQRWEGRHKLQFWVRPDHYGQYEDALIRWALATLGEYPSLPIELTLSTDHEAAMDAAKRHGFQVKRTLLTMRREILTG
jgi:ribosomal protein S18 acetylase RimI-like enzyme